AFNQRTPKEVVKSWMDSPGHRENILNKKYTELGIGIAADKNGELYYTQVFARPAAGNTEPISPEIAEAPKEIVPERSAGESGEPAATLSDDSKQLAELKAAVDELKKSPPAKTSE